MPANPKKQRTEKAQAKKESQKVEKWKNKQNPEVLYGVGINEDKEADHQDQLENAIILQKMGLPIEYVPTELRPPPLIRQKAVNLLSRQEQIKHRLQMEKLAAAIMDNKE